MGTVTALGHCGHNGNRTTTLFCLIYDIGARACRLCADIQQIRPFFHQSNGMGHRGFCIQIAATVEERIRRHIHDAHN